MYAVCTSRYVSRQMVSVALCDSAEDFVFVEGPATNRYPRNLQILLWQIRNSAYTSPVSSLRTLTLVAFVPAAFIVPSSLKSEGGVVLH